MRYLAPRDYSLIAPVYDHVFDKFLVQGHKKLGSLLKNKPVPGKNFRVLEVGVGSGLTLNHLPNSIHYTGVDINQKMLSQAFEKAKKLKRKKIELALMDAHKLKFTPASFDLVIAASVVTAVEDPDKVMKEMIRVTKKGGRIAVVANIRKNSYKSQLIKKFDPLTKKFLGFRTDMDTDYFQKFKQIRLVESQEINNILGFPLSSYLLFEKI